MNKVDKNRTNTMERVEQFINEKAAELAPVPEMADYNMTLGGIILDIRTAQQRQEVPIKGITVDKNAKKAELLTVTMPLVGGLKSWAKKSKNNQLFEEVNYNRSKLRKMRETDLIGVCEFIHAKATTHLPNLGTYGVDQAKLDNQQAIREQFEPLVEKYNLARAARKQDTAYIPQRVRDGMTFMREQMDPAMEYFSEEDPELYGEYLNVRKIVDYGIRHALNSALFGKVISSDDDAPIHKVKVRVIETGSVKHTTASGNYRYSVLPDGEYTLEFSKPNFQTQTVPGVKVIKGVPEEVNIAMAYAEALQSQADLNPDADTDAADSGDEAPQQQAA